MQAALWTMLMVAGSGALAQTETSYPVDGATTVYEGEVGTNSGAESHRWNALTGWWGPMPQTCYNPHFGCYPANNRHTQRFPAFHGHYYRSPYNYRQTFEYPWHANPHEPQRFDTHYSELGGQRQVQRALPPEMGPYGQGQAMTPTSTLRR